MAKKSSKQTKPTDALTNESVLLPTHVIYIPPAPETLEQVAKGVCKKLAETDPAFERSDVIYGFAAFLNVMASIHAHQMNNSGDQLESSSLDVEEQSEIS